MKVEGPKRGGSTSGTKNTSGAKSSGGADFSQYMTSGARSTVGAGATQSIAHIDALLAVQGAEDPTQRSAKKRVRARANIILDKMEQIRLAMLGGNLTVGHMIDVADVIASHRDKINDPVLSAIMDEIDLRAQVELAKMRISLDRKL
ncbi:MAG: flagellar assembly protein FliX [Alphaproteobacteria bacterium]|nr:flagellar assembly protein FliX [Alphaproteobacteria bacterium]